MNCPHCKHVARVRTSSSLSPLYREATYTCSNTLCGHVFVCGIEALRTLSPSAIPDPDVDLPLSKHVHARQLARQMTLALERERESH